MFLCALVIVTAVASASFASKQTSTGSKKLTLTSTSFKRNALMPARFGYGDGGDGFGIAGGENMSPQLSWKTKRTNIKSYALLMWDKHPIAEKWVHWCVVRIPPEMTTIPEGYSTTLVLGTQTAPVQLTNTFGFHATRSPKLHS